MRITFNNKLDIAGFYFLPQYNYSPPDYVNTLSFVEHNVTFGKAPYIISGTLTVPLHVVNPPCVIIVGGSGPVDRDMSDGANKPYKDIAWGLACKGIAVLRYDKRTYSYGLQLLSDKYAINHMTIKEEYLDDVKFAIGYLKTSKKIDHKKIFIVGHSEGGMLAPLICEQHKKIAGMVMMAGNARPMQDLMIEQMDYLYKDIELPAGEREKIEALKRHALYSKSPDLKPDFPEDSLPFTAAPYWISENKYKQIETAKKIKQPMLILQGERDYQVTMTDFNIWKEKLSVKKNCTFKSYPKLNHHFIEGEGKPNQEEYEKKGNVPEYVADDIANWIKGLQSK